VACIATKKIVGRNKRSALRHSCRPKFTDLPELACRVFRKCSGAISRFNVHAVCKRLRAQCGGAMRFAYCALPGLSIAAAGFTSAFEI